MKLSTNRIVLPLIALALTGLGFYHVSSESRTLPPTVPPESPARSPFENGIAASGVVEARTENVALGSALDGLVLEVYVPVDRVGTKVHAGQPLFRVDDRQLKAQLRVAEAQLAAAQASLEKLRQQPRPEELPPSLANVKSAAANTARLLDVYERDKRLVGTGAVSREEYVIAQRTYEAAVQTEAQAKAQYDLLKAGAWKPDIQIAEANVAQARAAVEQTKIEIDRATVTSPIDGVVMQVNVRAGERVTQMDTRALMVLGDLSTSHVRVDIDERDIARFRNGAAAKAYPRGATAHEIAMHFVRVEPYVVPKKSLTGDNTERVDTRVLQVIYAIEKTDAPVYVGQQLDVFIDTAAAKPASGTVAEGQ
jgi:multidrug resistance efflux pump